MKFALELKLNAVPRWTKQYIDYSRLKALIYDAERAVSAQYYLNDAQRLTTAQHSTLSTPVDKKEENISLIPNEKGNGNSDTEALLSSANAETGTSSFSNETQLNESSRLLLSVNSSNITPVSSTIKEIKTFVSALNQELDKVCSFYTRIDVYCATAQADLRDQIYTTTKSKKPQPSSSSSSSTSLTNVTCTVPVTADPSSSRDNGSAEQQYRIVLGTRLRSCYVELADLRAFADLNFTGFRKIVKKFDKVARMNFSPRFMRNVSHSYPFRSSTRFRLTRRIEKLEGLMCLLVPDTPPENVAATLKAHCVRPRVAPSPAPLIVLDNDPGNSQSSLTNADSNVLSLDQQHLVLLGPQDALSTQRSSQPPSNSHSRQPSFTGPYFATVFGSTGISDSSMLSLDPGPASNTNASEPPRAAARNMLSCFHRPYVRLTLFFFGKVLLLPSLVAGSTWWCLSPLPQAPCGAVVAACIVLWATEAVPLHVTAILAPLLLILLGAEIDASTGAKVPAPVAAKIIVSTMFTPTILMLLGGFSLASALSKYGISAYCAAAVLNRLGRRPSRAAAALMLVTTVLSALVGNVAAPALCYTAIQPVLRTLPEQAKSVAKALVISVAMAANVGGAMSPIASPQNLVALDIMKSGSKGPVTFMQWVFVSIPLCTCANIVVWLIICKTYKPDSFVNELFESQVPSRNRPQGIMPSQSDQALEGPSMSMGSDQMLEAGLTSISALQTAPLIPQNSRRRIKVSWLKSIAMLVSRNPRQTGVILITVSTLTIWCCGHVSDGVFGDPGIVGIVPLVLLGSLGLLDSDDVCGFPWTVVMLAMGGLAIGSAVARTGLLSVLGKHLLDLIPTAQAQHNNLELSSSFPLDSFSWILYCLCALAITLVSTMISHTVSAVILLPVVLELGNALEKAGKAVPGQRTFVLIGAFMCSAGMGLPVSGFPNTTAAAVSSPATRRPYLASRDFVKIGVPASLAMCLIACTLGYLLMAASGV